MEMVRMMSNHDGRICYRNLQRSNVKSSHVIFSAALVLVIDDVFSDVIVRIGVLDLGLPATIVDDKY